MFSVKFTDAVIAHDDNEDNAALVSRCLDKFQPCHILHKTDQSWGLALNLQASK